MGLTREELLGHFGTLWPVHHRAFTTMMVEFRRHFDGDMDEMLVLSAIGERTLTPQRTAGLSYVQFLNGRRNESKKGRINTQSISDSTGIPRESVRRKVARLMDRGWVRRNEDGTFEVTERAAADLAPATEATFDYLLNVGRIIVALVNDANSREAGHRAPREDGANTD
jgi:hypothetical protein